VNDLFNRLLVYTGVAVVYWIVELFKDESIPVRVKDNGFDEGLDRAARETGAQFEPRRRRSQSAKGTVGDAAISIATTMVDNEGQESFTELVVTVEGPRIPRGLSFAAEGGSGEDILTGDAVFDDVVEVHGEPSVVHALLDKEVRQKVVLFVTNRGSLRRGRLTGRSPLVVAESDVLSCVRMTVRLAEALSSAEGGGICPRLARNVVEDPVPGVRLLNLLQLQEAFGGTGEAREASRAALSDPSPWARLAAARFLQGEVQALEALARDREVPDQAAAEAIELLAARLSLERAGPLLVDVVKSRTSDARRQAIQELGRLRHGPALGPLVVVMERDDPRTAAAAATALGALGDPRAEVSLLGVLGRDDASLRLAAARALGRLGSVKSVAPLLALLEARGLDADGRQAIRGAIASIQSRLVGAGAGQLTVASAESESGRLTLSGSEAGALTLLPPAEE
jgi:HEAT repeat protein